MTLTFYYYTFLTSHDKFYSMYLNTPQYIREISSIKDMSALFTPSISNSHQTFDSET